MCFSPRKKSVKLTGVRCGDSVKTLALTIPSASFRSLNPHRFHSSRYTERCAFIQMAGEHLHTYRQPRLCSSARHRNTANPRQAGCHRVDIGQVHSQRIACLFAQFEGRRRRGRRHNRIHLGKGAQIFLGQQPPHLLRLQIVGVVVAGAQRVSSQQDAPLDLRAKALVARVRGTWPTNFPSAGER